MLGIDGPELLLIAAVALIFIGPKELPGMLRTVGKWVATARGLASEFRGHVDDMVRQADVEDLKKTVDPNAILDVQGLNPLGQIKAEMDAGAAEAQAEMDKAKSLIDDATSAAVPAPALDVAELAAPSSSDVPLAAADMAPPSVVADAAIAAAPAVVAQPAATDIASAPLPKAAVG